MQSQEEELSRAKADLNRLQQEENQLEQSLAAGKIQLETIIKSLKATQDEINQVGHRSCLLSAGGTTALYDILPYYSICYYKFGCICYFQV